MLVEAVRVNNGGHKSERANRGHESASRGCESDRRGRVSVLKTVEAVRMCKARESAEEAMV